MVRMTVDEFEIDDANIVIEFDTGGAVGSEYLVIVNGDDYVINRWFYFDEFNEDYARNFAKKIARNEEYRKKSLEGEADWCKVENTYDKYSHLIYKEFQERGLMSYKSVPEDREGKKRYEIAQKELNDICKELFEGVYERIRHPEKLDDSTPPLNVFVDDKLEEGRKKAEEIDNMNLPK